jgi:hypothetical protein
LALVGKNKRVILVSILQMLSSYLQLQYLEVEFHAAGSSEANNCLALTKIPNFYGTLMFSTVFHILNYKFIIAFMRSSVKPTNNQKNPLHIFKPVPVPSILSS